MTVWGNLIEARKNALKTGEDGPGLVPDSWELCRIAPGATPEVIAKGVLSFDLEANGGLIYCNGSTISRRSPLGEISRLHRDVMIQQVVAAGD